MDLVIGLRDGIGHDPEYGPVVTKVPFGLSIAQRRQHLLLLGKTGVGKSTALRNMLIQDIQAGRGCLFIDPHGDEAERLLDYIPPWRFEDLIYLDPTDLSRPIGFNLLERDPPEDRALAASNIVSIFRHYWADAWGGAIGVSLALLRRRGSRLSEGLRRRELALRPTLAHRRALSGQSCVSQPQCGGPDLLA
jgi:hypothetical protein